MALDKIASVAGGPVGMAVMGGIQAAMGVAQMFQAGAQNREAKKMQKNLVDPKYQIAQGVRDNLSLAESRASQGLSDAAMTVYENQMDRNMTTGIDAILRGGGSINSMADLYDTGEDNRASLLMLEEEMRLKNTQMYIAANERMAQEQDKEFQINVWAPDRDKRQAITALRGQANQNKWAGANTMAGAVGNYVQANMMQNNIDSVYGSGARVTPNQQSPVPQQHRVANVNTAREENLSNISRNQPNIPGPLSPFTLPVNQNALPPYLQGSQAQVVPSYADHMINIIKNLRR